MANNSRLDSMPFNSINDLIDHWETHPAYPVERGRPSPLPQLNRPLGYGPYEDMDEHERTPEDLMIQRRNPLYGERHRNGGRLSFRDGGSPGRGNPDDRTRDRGRRFMPHEMHQNFPAHPGEYNLSNPTPRHWHRKPWQFYNKAADGGRQNLSPQLPFWERGYDEGGGVPQDENAWAPMVQGQSQFDDGQLQDVAGRIPVFPTLMGVKRGVKEFNIRQASPERPVVPLDRLQTILNSDMPLLQKHNVFPQGKIEELNGLASNGEAGKLQYELRGGQLEALKKSLKDEGYVINDASRGSYYMNTPEGHRVRISTHHNPDDLIPQGRPLAYRPATSRPEGLLENHFNAVLHGDRPLLDILNDVRAARAAWHKQQGSPMAANTYPSDPSRAAAVREALDKLRKKPPQFAYGGRTGYAPGGPVQQNPFGQWSDVDLAGMTPAMWAQLMARSKRLYQVRPDLEGKVIPPIHEPRPRPLAPQSNAELEDRLRSYISRSTPRPGGKFSDVFVSPTMADTDPRLKSGLLPSIPGVTTPVAPPLASAPPRPNNISPFTPPTRNPNLEDLERMRVQQGLRPPAEIRQLPRRVPINQGPEIGQTIDLRKPERPQAEILPRDVGTNPESRMNWWDNMRENRNEPPMSIGPGDVIDWVPPKRQYGGRIGYDNGGGVSANPFEFGSAQSLLDAEREAQLGIAPVTEEQVRENAARRQQYFQTAGRQPASRFPDNAPPAATAWPEAAPTNESREDFWRARDIPEAPQQTPSEPATDQYSRNVWADPNSGPAMLGGLASGKIGRAAPYGGWKEEPEPRSRYAPGYQQAPMLQGIKEQQANMAGQTRRRPGLYDRGTGPILDDAPLSEWMVHHLAALMPDALVSGESGSKEQVDEYNAKLKAQGLPYHVKGMLGIPRRPEVLDSMSPNDRERELYQRKLHAAQGIYSSATELPVPPFLTAYTLGHIDPATRAFIKGDYAELAALGVGAGAAGGLRMAWPIRSMPSSPFGARDPEGFLVRHNWEDDARQKSLGQPARIHRDLMPVDTSRWEVKLKEGQSHPELLRDRVAQWEVFETPTRGGQQKKVAEFTSQHAGPRWHGNQQWLEIQGLKPVGSYQITPDMLKTIQPQIANIYPQSKGFIDQNFRIKGTAKNSHEQFVTSPMQKFEYYPEKPYQPDVPGGTIPGLRHQNPFSLTQGFDPSRYRYQRLTTANDPYVRELFEKHAAERGLAAPPIAEATPGSWERMQRLYRERNWMRRPQAAQSAPAVPEAAPVSPLRVETPALPMAANTYPKPPTMLEIDRMARQKGISRQEMVKALEDLGLYTAPKANGGSVGYAGGGSIGFYMDGANGIEETGNPFGGPNLSEADHAREAENTAAGRLGYLMRGYRGAPRVGLPDDLAQDYDRRSVRSTFAKAVNPLGSMGELMRREGEPAMGDKLDAWRKEMPLNGRYRLMVAPWAAGKVMANQAGRWALPAAAGVGAALGAGAALYSNMTGKIKPDDVKNFSQEIMERAGEEYGRKRADGGRADRRPPWYRPPSRQQDRPSDSMKIQDAIGPDVPIYNNNMAPPPPPRMDYKSIWPEVMQPRVASGGRVQRYAHKVFWDEDVA